MNIQALIHSLHFQKNLCQNCHTNFLFIIHLHIFCTIIANYYQLVRFSIFQLDWRVKVDLIIEASMKKLNCESMCQYYCWLEGFSYHVMYISKLMNMTRYYFSRYSILYHKFSLLIVRCFHSTKIQARPPFK